MFQEFEGQNFNQYQIAACIQDLQARDVECEVVWMRGKRKVDFDDEIANRVTLASSKGRFFSQSNTVGRIDTDGLEPEEQQILMAAMKRHNICARPRWVLSITLFVIYWILLINVADSLTRHSDTVLAVVAAVLLIIATVGSLAYVAFYFFSRLRIPNYALAAKAQASCITALIFTVPASLLLLPLLHAIDRNFIYCRLRHLGHVGE